MTVRLLTDEEIAEMGSCNDLSDKDRGALIGELLRMRKIVEPAKALVALFDPSRAMSRFDWGKAFLSGQDIRELNEAPLNLRRALINAGVSDNAK